MTINGYLTNLANQAILRDDEKAGVQRSITTLQTRLVEHFGSQINQHFVFGSYSRGTILPRSIDPQSDVDYMVNFSDSGLLPQSYLDRLRRFAELRYARSEVAQSHPTVALDLNHIRFELVPALPNWLNGQRIPAKGFGYQSWQETDPKGFNDKLTNANQANGNLIKPLVRIMKYWNAKADYPFESYALEQQIVGHGFGFLGFLASHQISDYFFQIVEALNTELFAPQWKRDAAMRLKQLAGQARALERAGGQTAQAEAVIIKLLPPVGGLLGR
jgi:predicted nucleotidyltransferase